MNTNQAIHMIQDHFCRAFETADGLLAIANVAHLVSPMGEHADDGFEGGLTDCWFEESTVFEVRDDGTVDSEAIRRWLGY